MSERKSLTEIIRERAERSRKEREEALANLPEEGVTFDPLEAAYLRQFLAQMAQNTSLAMASLHLIVQAKLEPYHLDRLPLPDATEILRPELLGLDSPSLPPAKRPEDEKGRGVKAN